MRTQFRNSLWVIIFFGVIALCICFSSCKKEIQQPEKQTVTAFYDAPVLKAIEEIQRAVTDPKIDGYEFQAKVDSLDEYINENPVSIEVQQLEQNSINAIELKYNFIIDHYEGKIPIR